jgi:hypothetical protein
MQRTTVVVPVSAALVALTIIAVTYLFTHKPEPGE